MSFRTYATAKTVTPQTQSAREDQVPNSAGGYIFALDPLKQLQRFLILGTTGGTYYTSEHKLTDNNLKLVENLMNNPELAAAAINLIVEISKAGRAPKNDPALVALAIAASSKLPEVRKYALKALPEVARIPTHLFHFLEFCKGRRGWGRAFSQAIADWYNQKNPDALSFLMAKYQQRDGWAHGDVIKLGHIKAASEKHNLLFRWALGEKEVQQFGLVEGLTKLNAASTEEEVISLVNQYNAPFECVPTKWLKSIAVWDALLPNLGYEAVVRSLRRMGQAGYLLPGAFDHIAKVVARLSDEADLQKSKIHPIKILSALRTYQKGKSIKGDGQWEVCHQIVDTLDEMFYKAFGNVESTGKRFYIAVDCSASMTWSEVAGVPGLTPRTAAAVLAMVIARREPNSVIKGFCTGMQELPITPKMSLAMVENAMESVSAGGTDCAQPILDASKRNLKIDAFVTVTDNETWAEKIHPFQALQSYRKQIGIEAKNIVIGMTATGFSICDPRDKDSLDMVGFDSASPQVISDFVLGNI